MTRTNAVRKFRADTMEGMRFVWDRRGLRALILVNAALNFVIVPTGIALPILVRDYLGRGAEFLGLMGACQSAGAVAGFALVGTVKIAPCYRPHIVGAGIFVTSTVILLLGINRVPQLSLVLLALFGFQLPLVNVNFIAVIQGTTPSEIRGRVMGLLGTLILGLIPIAQGLSGLLIDAMERRVPVIYVAVGVISMVLIGLAWSNRSFREFLATDFERSPGAA